MSTLSRRELLRLSGVSLASGLVLAACGKQYGVINDKAIVSLGQAPPSTQLAEAEVTDAVLLRTAASLEANLLVTYKFAVVSGLFVGDFAKTDEVSRRFGDDHQAHLNAVNALIVALGAKEVRCPNKKISDAYIQPALKIITADDNPNPTMDLVALLHAVENLAAQTYQGLVAMLSAPNLRAEAIRIGQQDARHAALLAQVLNPGLAKIGPTSNVTTGKPNIAAVPSAFGSMANIPVALGAPKPDGSQNTLLFETPSLNSLVYDFVTCQD